MAGIMFSLSCRFQSFTAQGFKCSLLSFRGCRLRLRLIRSFLGICSGPEQYLAITGPWWAYLVGFLDVGNYALVSLRLYIRYRYASASSNKCVAIDIIRGLRAFRVWGLVGLDDMCEWRMHSLLWCLWMGPKDCGLTWSTGLRNPIEVKPTRAMCPDTANGQGLRLLPPDNDALSGLRTKPPDNDALSGLRTKHRLGNDRLGTYWGTPPSHP